MDDYWSKQNPDEPLFPDVLWSKPESRNLAGKIAIAGGNSQGFAAVAAAYQTALATGAGEAKVVLPDTLKNKLPVLATDAIFAPTNPSGGFAKDAINELNAAADFADVILFVGDSGQNSETAGLFENFLASNKVEVVITRDAVDLVKNFAENVLNRERTHIVVSFSQLQKLFREVYYPRVLTFSQGVRQIAETLHKFTISYGVAITLFHQDNLFVASGGEVISQKFEQPLRVWSGEIATREAVWQIWQKDAVKAVATSWTEL